MKISTFNSFLKKNANFEKKIRKKIQSYKDHNIRMMFNMIRNATLFG